MKSKEYKYFRFFYILVYLPVMLLYRVRAVGRENIPEGGAVFCANHSNWADPFLLVFALKRKNYVHIMAKVEIFKNKLIGWALKLMGMISVNRGATDINSIKSALRYLHNDEKICIFPEGTRISEDFAVAAKNGAIKIAEKSGKPIVPVHIPRRKHLFGSVKVVIGEPYYINPERRRLPKEAYDEMAQELMVKIKSLDTENI